MWTGRHRGIVATLWLHIAGIAAWSAAAGGDTAHWIVGTVGLAVPALVAASSRLPRALRSSLSTAGLVAVSAVLVHLMDGHVEARYHFFLVIAIVTLYQSWWPFAVATAMTTAHHVAVSALPAMRSLDDPTAASSPLASSPLWWSLVHAGFVLAVAGAHMVSWRLNEEARRDPLTALTDRALFEARLSQLLRGREQTTVMLVDLDDFKRVNDTHGHAVGDQLLVAVAERLLVATRHADQVARLGGDEFAVLLAGVEIDQAELVAERLTEALSRPFSIEGTEIFVSSSVGVAAASAGGAADLVRDADTAMYVSKRAGKARWTVFRPAFREELVARAETLEQLRTAVAEHRFSLRYVPVASLLTGSVVGWSTELVWDRPGGESVPASAAAPGSTPASGLQDLLDESGLIIDVGRRARQDACAELMRRRAADVEASDAFVDLTVSLRELQEPDFATDFAHTLESTGCPPDSVMLSVAEAVVLSDDEVVAAHLQQLARLGVWITLDGFGSGQSSIAGLRPDMVGTVRLDRSLTSDLSPRRRSLAVGVVTVANACGLVVMADSVGTSCELDLLRRLGVELVRLREEPTSYGWIEIDLEQASVHLDAVARGEVITLPELLQHERPTVRRTTRSLPSTTAPGAVRRR